MKTRLLNYFLPAIILFFLAGSSVYGQEVTYNTTDKFYYNSFDNGSLGVFNNSIITGAANQTIATAATTTTSFNGTAALTSIPGVNQKNNIYGQILPATPTTERDLNTNDFEWTFLYKNNSTTSPVEPYDNGLKAGPASGQAAWQYWLTANDKDQSLTSIQGFYMTQVGSDMILRYRVSQDNIQSLINFPITNNVLWTIKVQRLYNSTTNSCAWRIWANPVSGTNYEATQSAGTANQVAFNNYVYSILAVTDLRAAGNNFYFDNIKLYTRKMSFTGINAASNGITQPSYYPTQTNVALFGLQVNTRGTYNINKINLGLTSSAGTNVNAFFTNGRIVRSTDNNLATTTDNSTLASFSPQSMPIQSGTFSTIDATSSSGGADGSLTTVSNYFLVVDILSTTASPNKFNYGNPGPYTTYTFTGPAAFNTTENNNNQPSGGFTNNASSGNNAITFTPSAPLSKPTVTSPGAMCGTGTISLNATGGTGGTYDWYTASTAGVLLQSSASGTYTPFVAGTTTFYVCYTISGTSSARAAVTVTVNPKVATPLTNATLLYPFNNTYEDISGNKNDALSYGATAPAATTDRYGTPNSAFNFNGSTQYLSSSITNYDPQVYSLSLWFRTTTTQGGKLMGFVQSVTPGQSGQFDRHIYMSTAGKLYFGVYLNGTKTIITNKAYNDGLWHHVVVTVAPATATAPLVAGAVMYVDGVSVGTNTTITGGEPHNGYWRIGGDNLQNWTDVTTGTSYFFNGDIDDVGVYYRSLTPAEATASNDLNLIGNIVTYCQNNTISLVAPAITGATYTWADNANTANTYTGNPGVFSSASSGTYTLTVLVNGCSSTAVVTPGSPVYTWTGAAGTTATNTAGNWTHTSTGEVGFVAPPFAGTETIIIPSTATVFPELTGNISIYSLNIAPGASLSLNGRTLNVGCNIYNNNTAASGILYGPVTAGITTSQINWNGSVASQNYIGAGTTTPAQFANMTVNNIATGTVNIISGKVDITNLLTMTKGTLAVASSATLTLKSTSTLTASVPALGIGTSITGNVTVERWFTGGNISNRGWRLMSSPVNNPGTPTPTYNFVSLQTNLPVTGNGTGFDTPSGYTINGATILFYNTATKLFDYPGSPSDRRPVGSGFYFYFRGNKTNILSKLVRSGSPAAFATPEANVVGLQTGTLNQQNITYNLSNAGNGYNIVGNPYPSTITLPSGTGANTVCPGTTGFIYTYSSGANSLSPQPGPVNIASGQGFFLKSNSGTSSINFTESLKTQVQLTGSNLLLGKPVGSEAPIIALKMVQDSANYDVTYVRFLDSYKTTYDEMEDADDLNGSGQAVFLGTMTSDNHQVAIASQPLGKQKTSIFLSVNDNTSGLYTIKKMDLSGIPSVYDVWLMDHFKKDSLDIRANDTYNFNIDKTNAQTFGNTRFEIVIRKKVLPPYQLMSFTVTRSGTDVVLNWNTLNEYDYTLFELQKSTDGVNFDAVKNIQSSSQGSYGFKDIYNNSSTTKVYYRLKQVDVNDQISYSNVIIITTTGSGTFNIFPNPATDAIQFKLDQPVKSQVRLSIFNALGILVKSSNFTSSNGQQDISSLMPGNYTIELTDLNSKKIILAGKFIKI